MKMRRVFSLVMICLLLQLSAYMSIPAAAATALSITQPSNWAYLSKNSPGTLKWSKVTGAAGYTVTIKNDATGEYYTQNEWTTKTSYSLKNLFNDALTASEYPRLKIWVGAMKSTDISQGLVALDAQNSIIAVVSEEPDVSLDSITNINTSGATLTMTLSKDYGSAIIDSGFYVGTSSETTAMTKYSFSSYGTATTKGTKTMTITGLQAGTKYYVKAYAKNGVDEAVTTPKSFTTTATTVPLSISTNSVSWDYGSGNESEITVTCSGTYSCKIEYALSDQESSGYDYEWLDYEISGNSLWLRPARTNYYAKSRTAKVTVTCGSENKEITVTQGACGEDEPKIEIKQGSSLSSLSTVPNGTNWGNYSAEGTDTLYLYAGIKNVRRITVNIKKVGDLYSVNDETFTYITPNGDVACFMPVAYKNGNGLPAGEYQVDIWASNSATENDYWAQKPDKITMYFSIKASGSDEESLDFANISSKKDYPNIPIISKDASVTSTSWNSKNTIVYVQQQYSGNDLYDATIWGTDGGVGKCTRASTSSAFSYLNIRALPKNIGDTIGEVTTNCNCYDNPYGAYALANDCSVTNLRFCKNEMTLHNFVEIYNKYANDTAGIYSPPIIYTNYYNKGNSMHTLLIVGHSSSEPNVFYVLNSGNNGGSLEKIKLKEIDGQIRIAAKTKGNEWSTDHYNQNYLPRQLWQYVKQNTTEQECSHSWGPWQDKGTYRITYCTLCGTSKRETIYNSGSFSVSYDANGGQSAPDTTMVTKNSVISISDVKPTRSGYTFLGWDTSADATTAEYQAGDSYTVTGGVTFYAVWQKNGSSGGSGGGSSAPAEKYAFNLVNSSGSSATVSVTNNTGSKVSARLLIAAYDSSNKMIGCSVAEKTWNNGTNAEIALTCGNRISYVKVFILDINTNAPLFKSWQKTL